MSGRLRWKRVPRQRGLAGIGAGPMGSRYTNGETEFASTFPLSGDRSWIVVGWAFWARVGSDVVNTTSSPLPDEDTAKRQAVEWVKTRLAAQAK